MNVFIVCMCSRKYYCFNVVTFFPCLTTELGIEALAKHRDHNINDRGKEDMTSDFFDGEVYKT